MIHESLGESGAFHLRHGYHVDVLRDSIFETLPPGWKERLVLVPGCDGAFALDPHDLALVRHLATTERLSRITVEQRLDAIPKADRLILASSKTLQQAFEIGN